MKLEQQLEDWGKVRAMLDMVRVTRFREQKEWFEKYLELRNGYELKYRVKFQYGRQPE